MGHLAFIWLAVIVLILVVEASTMALVSVWFLPGALVSLVLALFHVELLWQIVAFAALSLVVLLFGRKLFRPFAKKEKTNVDALIGQTAVITEPVNNVQGKGTAKIGANVWSARAQHDDDLMEVGTLVTVVDIQGVKLICRRKDA